MSLDITFEKSFTLDEIKKTTSIEIKYEKNKHWLVKNGSCILINTEEGETEFDSITRYGENELTEIMNEIVINSQTRFITDNELPDLFNSKSEKDTDKLFNDTTIKYGYKINNDGVISL